MTQTPVVEICVAKSRPQDQQSALDYYTFCLPGGVILKRGEKNKKIHC